jgi:hypothetical protein
MRPIAVFYHALLATGDPPGLSKNCMNVVHHQMQLVGLSGLAQACSEFRAGVNGGGEAEMLASGLLPDNAIIKGHPIASRNECRTIQMIEDWLPGHPGWNVLYFHTKGSTYPAGDEFTGRWRHCMMSNLIWNWSRCVHDLDKYESVGCHWMNKEQHGDLIDTPYWGGNFWWARSDFLMTVPKLATCGRIRTGQSGLDDYETRFEAEVWIGRGRPPTVLDYHRNWKMGSSVH